MHIIQWHNLARAMISLKTWVISSLVVISYISYEGFQLLSPPKLPVIDEDIWWRVEERPELEDESVKEFRINISEEIIIDLKTRLKNHRLVAPYIEGSINKYGTNLLLLKDFVEFWMNTYNWTERQEYLNKYPQYVTNIQGLDIYFIHIKPDIERKNQPLLLLHGWPGSVGEFYDVIEILQNTNFELILPSLPGFGFSQAASRPGLSLVQAAVIMKKLMNRLGHQKFYVQGGDLGSITLQIMSVLYPETVLGFHTNFPIVYTMRSYLKPILASVYPSWLVKPDHYDRVYPLADKGLFIFKESGYIHLQSTKPDSVGVALDDSPIGLAAYFLEKFIIGSNLSWVNDFGISYLKEKFSYTQLLDNLMYYWVTGSVVTAFRLYYETFGEACWSETITVLRNPVTVPTIIVRSKHDLYMPDGILSEIYPNLLNLTDHDTGHFPAFENPQLFSENILKAMEMFERNEIASSLPEN